MPKTNNIKCCAIAYTFYERDWRVRRYCEALVENGYEVDMIALRSEEQDKVEFLNGVRIFRIQRRSFKKDSLPIYLANYLRFFIKGTVILVLNHMRSHYRMVHVHNMPDFLVFMALIPKIFGAKVIFDIHDILPEFYAQKFNTGIKAFPIRLLLIMEKISVKFSDYVITANDIWRERVISRDGINPGKIITLLNYPSLKYHDQGLAKKEAGSVEFKLVYPGTISWIHGIDILIKGIGHAKKQIPDIKLDIFCIEERTVLVEQYGKMINDLGLEDNIRFNKALNPEVLAPMLATYDAGVVPKRGGIFADEAFSSKIFDFMAAGLPIIASRTKVDEYYFDDTMIMFFMPEDAEGLGSRIVEMYNDKDLQKHYQRTYKNYMEYNNWEVKKHLYLQIVDDLTTKDNVK